MQKPGWMQVLEAESWQAELIISGIAIFGSLQLPNLYNRLIGWMVFNVTEEISILTYLIALYLVMAVSVLILAFIVHFILRALWIALIGLSSVYPEGIRSVENQVVSKRLIGNIKEELGNLDAFNEALDRTCSSLLALTFSLVFATTGFTVFLSVLIALLMGMSYVFPGLELQNYLFLFFLAVPILAILNSIANLPGFRNHPWVVRFHYPLARTIGLILFNVGYRPYMLIQYVFITNINLKQFYLRFAFVFTVVMILGMVIFIRSDALFLLTNVFVTDKPRTYQTRATSFEVSNPEGELILRPILQQPTVADPSVVTLFVPVVRRERDRLLTLCPYPDTLENRSDRFQWQLDCVPQHYQFFLNDVPFTNYSVLHHQHPNRNERGFLFQLFDLPLQAGQNWLIVQTPLEDSNGKRHRVALPVYRTSGSG